MNFLKRWFPPNDWETLSSHRSIIQWSDRNNQEETLALYHLQFSKHRNRYRVNTERVSKSRLLENTNSKDHKMYFEVLVRCNELNVEKMDEESERENPPIREHPEPINTEVLTENNLEL